MVRDGNEDSYLVDRRLDLFAVADGMGGHRAGEIASATALDGLRTAVDEGTTVADAVGRANTAVWDKAAGDTELAGMGTTLTAAIFDGTTLAIAHVGDSRAYLLRGDRLERLTTDHSLVAYALTVATALVVTTTRVHPLWLLAVGGVIGAAGWV